MRQIIRTMWFAIAVLLMTADAAIADSQFGRNPDGSLKKGCVFASSVDFDISELKFEPPITHKGTADGEWQMVNSPAAALASMVIGNFKFKNEQQNYSYFSKELSDDGFVLRWRKGGEEISVYMPWTLLSPLPKGEGILCREPIELGTSAWPQTGVLPHRTTKQLAPSIYHSVSDKEEVVGKLDPLTGKIDDSPMFENVIHTFIGEIQEFVLGVSNDGTKKVISAAHLKYNQDSKTNPVLSMVGNVYLNEKGIVQNENAKSGWINYIAYGRYTDSSSGKYEKIEFEGVSFWVNRGGKNWWDFKVNKALTISDGKEIDILPEIEQIEPGVNRPVIKVFGKYKLVPRIVSLGDITFVEEKKQESNNKYSK